MVVAKVKVRYDYVKKKDSKEVKKSWYGLVNLIKKKAGKGMKRR